MSFTFNQEVTLTTTVCCTCGVTYAMPERLREQRKEHGGNFYCPNGHPQIFSESDVTRLTRERDAARRDAAQQREAYFAEQRRHEATQREMRRIKKRAAAGVCPCCQRTFQQLSRHMQGKHPDYVKEHGVPKVEEKH